MWAFRHWEALAPSSAARLGFRRHSSAESFARGSTCRGDFRGLLCRFALRITSACQYRPTTCATVDEDRRILHLKFPCHSNFREALTREEEYTSPSVSMWSTRSLHSGTSVDRYGQTLGRNVG